MHVIFGYVYEYIFVKKTVSYVSVSVVNNSVFSFQMVQYVKRQTSAQMVAKQHLKLHLRRIRNREYSRLRDMVPSIAKKDKISKVNYNNDFGGLHIIKYVFFLNDNMLHIPHLEFYGKLDMSI